MTDTLADTLPFFPAPRAQGCPFDPPANPLESGKSVARMRIWDGNTPWVVFGYEEQRQALVDPRLSHNPWPANKVPYAAFPHSSEGEANFLKQTSLLIAMDNPEHAVYRRAVTKYLTVKRVEGMRQRTQQIVDGLIDKMLSGPKPVDLMEAFALPVPSTVICEMLGMSYENHSVFERCSHTMHSRNSTEEEIKNAFSELQDLCLAVIDARSIEPRDDVISGMILEQLRPGLLTREEVATLCLLLLIGGHDTSANMIGLGTLALLRNPAQFAELRDTDDPKLVNDSVEELLRYLAIGHLGRRRVATEDLEIGGCPIKAGEGVICANNVGNRDPKAFEGDTNKLDLHRKSAHHLTFSYGNHYCPGHTLARMELQVVYGTLYRRIPSLALAIPFEAVEFKDDMVIYGLHALPVTW